MVAGDTDIDVDPGCGRATDPDMALSISALDTMALGGSTATQICMAPTVSGRLLDTNVATGDSPDPKHLYRL